MRERREDQGTPAAYGVTTQSVVEKTVKCSRSAMWKDILSIPLLVLIPNPRLVLKGVQTPGRTGHHDEASDAGQGLTVTAVDRLLGAGKAAPVS